MSAAASDPVLILAVAEKADEFEHVWVFESGLPANLLLRAVCFCFRSHLRSRAPSKQPPCADEEAGAGVARGLDAGVLAADSESEDPREDVVWKRAQAVVARRRLGAEFIVLPCTFSARFGSLPTLRLEDELGG